MELLFVTVIGAGIGLALRYLLPRRDTYGVLLLPAVSAAATAIVWVALVWVGWTFDGTWIWVASLGAAVIAAVLTAVVLPRRRLQSDESLFARLAGAKA
ncbi:hypothetical protein [Antiquaquibacter soli]|uniref:Integral membrane protein n=1 Tax=Antiquaquibacter soli TaxID=3064523 RepID=A0ABT9BPV9_9MICO|nr:hypothetical protein [Protaetiibacter sp. WY-16]MDO7881337.1 hypothetical protein [Protaetiibacter sp. WY-16]